MLNNQQRVNESRRTCIHEHHLTITHHLWIIDVVNGDGIGAAGHHRRIRQITSTIHTRMIVDSCEYLVLRIVGSCFLHCPIDSARRNVTSATHQFDFGRWFDQTFTMHKYCGRFAGFVCGQCGAGRHRRCHIRQFRCFRVVPQQAGAFVINQSENNQLSSIALLGVFVCIYERVLLGQKRSQLLRRIRFVHTKVCDRIGGTGTWTVP